MVIIVISLLIMAALHLLLYAMFVPVAGLVYLHVLQRVSGVALDKYWKASIHKQYDSDRFKDAMHMQMVFIGLGLLMAFYSIAK